MRCVHCLSMFSIAAYSSVLSELICFSQSYVVYQTIRFHGVFALSIFCSVYPSHAHKIFFVFISACQTIPFLYVLQKPTGKPRTISTNFKRMQKAAKPVAAPSPSSCTFLSVASNQSVYSSPTVSRLTFLDPIKLPTLLPALLPPPNQLERLDQVVAFLSLR